MNDDFLSNLTFTNLVQSFMRQKIRAIVFSLVFFAILFVALLFLQKKYESEGKMFVRLGRGGVTLDPTATTSETIMVQESRESEINSIVDAMRSRGVLNIVVNKPSDPTDPNSETIGERILESQSILKTITDLIPKFPAFGEEELIDGKTFAELEKNDLAIEALHDSLIVKAPRKSSSISISCRSHSAKLSQAIVVELMQTYIEQHVKARQTDGSFNFFEEQFEKQNEMVSSASEALSKYKNEIGVMSVGERRASLRAKISEIEKNLVSVASNLAAAKTKEAELEKMIAEMPDQLVIEQTEGVANQGSDLMRDRLYDLEIQEKDLLSRFEPTHPEVVAVKRQLKQAQAIMMKQKTDRTLTKRGLNANVQAIGLELMQATVAAASFASEKKILDSNLESAFAEMQKLNEDEIKLARLQRDLNRAEKNFSIYSEKQEEARINLALDQKQISNVKIIQKATLQVKHVSPRYKLIAAAGLICSVLAGICLAVFLDQFNRKMHRPEEIEDELGLDVLTTIPVLSRRALQLK